MCVCVCVCVCVIIVIYRGRGKIGGVAVQGCSGQVHLSYINVNSSNIPTYIHRTYIHTCIHLTYIHTHIHICVCMPVCVIIVIDGGRGKTGGGAVQGCGIQVNSFNIHTSI